MKNNDIETCVVLADDWLRGQCNVVYCGTDFVKAYEMWKKLNNPMGLYLQVWFRDKIIRKYESVLKSPYDDRLEWVKVFDLKEEAEHLLKINQNKIDEANSILNHFI